MAPGADAAGERRQLTAFFCDLVGSTELSANLDPEDYFEVVRAYHERSAELVARYGGHVAQYLGDGLLAYFGYPRALEDAPERAIRTGLAIIAALDDLNARLERDAGVRLSLRVGIHTGTVVLGETGGQATRETLALGETLNLAARLQGIASPDSVVISGDAERLVRGLFVTEDLGPQQLKGFARPISAYRVAGTTGVRGRLDLLGEAGLTPFVGRAAELDRLVAIWEASCRGCGRVAVLTGEPGIGKSRLARALRQRAGGMPHTWLELQCSPWTENTAFYPIIDFQKRLFEMRDHQGTLARFETALRDAGLPVEETVPLFAALHGIPLPAERQAAPLSREAQRRKTLETLGEWLLRLGRDRPVVLLVEDVQWIDPSTAEVVGRLGERIVERPVLLLLTHRPDFVPPWLSGDAVVIHLERLLDEDARRVVAEVASAAGFPRERMMELVARAEGVPLYLEELTKAALESAAPGATARDTMTIPATLRDSLMARLDRLGPAKHLALFASVIGREFPYALLAAAAPEEELRTRLGQLVESGLVLQTGEPPDATYRFKHALIRDEAYQSLVRSVRRQYHTRIGEALEANFPQETAARPELVGHHFLEGGDADKGVLYLMMAARRAVTSSANVEAIHHAERALHALATRPASAMRSQLELALWTLRGGAMIAIRGYAADEVQETFARARTLATEVGDSPQLVPVLHGLWLYHMVRGDRAATAQLAEQLLAVGEGSQDPTARLFGLTVAGIQRFFQGHFEAAIDYVERAVALYDPSLHDQLVVTYSLGTTGVARVNAATCWWFLGYPDRARELIRVVLEAARAARHPFTLAGVHVMSSMLFHLCGDPVSARALEEEGLRIATEQGFPLWIGGALCGLGTSIADLGDLEEGIERTRQGLALFRATGARTNTACLLGGMAALYHMNGRYAEAEQVVDEALELVERHLEMFYAPELWRLKGEVTLARTADVHAAQLLFDRALAMARAEHARSLELRAAMSLARLAERRHERRQAFDLLAPIYGSFSEGFDTRDLREACTLLDRLR